MALLNLEPHLPGASPWHLSCFRLCHRGNDRLPVRLGPVAAPWGSVPGVRDNELCNNELSDSKPLVENTALPERKGICLFLLLLCQEASLPVGFTLEHIN